MKTNDIFATLCCLGLLVGGCSNPQMTERGPLDPGADPGGDDSPIPDVEGAPDSVEGTPLTPLPPAASGTENTFDHPAAIGGRATSAREALERMERQGPPVFSARVHSCRKMRYSTLGSVLEQLGVNMAATGDTQAGFMYASADQALGAPNYGARQPEGTELTVASSSRLFDILVQAAPEIEASLPTRAECMVGGRPTFVFDAAGRCTEAGLTCLLGEPAQDVHVELCNDIVGRASTPEQGRAVAIASMLAAVFTCE